jgi:nucleoside-diphosphate-sugar epimerase
MKERLHFYGRGLAQPGILSESLLIFHLRRPIPDRVYMDIVTGSFGYIGKYITQALILSGEQVKTITTHRDKPNPFGDNIKAYPYNFDNPELLLSLLKGCDTLFNTYWVRFNYGLSSFEKALRNTKILFDSAKKYKL